MINHSKVSLSSIFLTLMPEVRSRSALIQESKGALGGKIFNSTVQTQRFCDDCLFDIRIWARGADFSFLPFPHTQKHRRNPTSEVMDSMLCLVLLDAIRKRFAVDMGITDVNQVKPQHDLYSTPSSSAPAPTSWVNVGNSDESIISFRIYGRN